MDGEVECEIRWKIKELGKFQESLQKRGWELKGAYSAVDYYYQPVHGSFWNPEKKFIKIREWKTPESNAYIYLVQNDVVVWRGNSYKKTFPPLSKVKLYDGSIKVCRAVLRSLGFEEWLIIEITDGRLWQAPKSKRYLALEKVHGMGWTGRMDFVGKTVRQADEKMRKSIGRLKISRRHVKIKTLLVMFAEKEGRLEKPSRKARLKSKEELLMAEAREEFLLQKKLEKFKKQLEKKWQKQEKKRRKTGKKK